MLSQFYPALQSARDQSIARWLAVIAMSVVLLSAALAF